MLILSGSNQENSLTLPKMKVESPALQSNNSAYHSQTNFRSKRKKIAMLEATLQNILIIFLNSILFY